MPSDITTPATFAYSAGAARTTRIVSALFRYSSSSIVTSFDTPLTEPAEIPSLSTQKRQIAIGSVEIGGKRYPVYVEMQEQLRQQRVNEAIVDAFEAVNARVDEVALYARLNAVEALAESANDKASEAQTTVAQVSTSAASTFGSIDPIYQTEFEDGLSPL